jgi:hypothetical protein
METPNGKFKFSLNKSLSPEKTLKKKELEIELALKRSKSDFTFFDLIKAPKIFEIILAINAGKNKNVLK